jgi:hypothetical protein
MHALQSESSFRQFRLTVVSLAVGLLAGCGPASVQALPAQVDGEEAVPSRPPTLKETHEATAPDYKSPPGVKHECFGRLVFDVPQPVEWPTFYRGYTDSLFNRSFSKNVVDPGDEMRFGNTLVAVISSVGGSLKERVLESTPAALEAHLKTRIKEKSAYIAELRAKGADTDAAVREIHEEEKIIRGWEETIKEDQENFGPFNPGLPNSEGYWTSRIEASDETNRFSVLRAYLTRGEFIYVFESAVRMFKPADKEDHKKDFAGMLAKFRTRTPNEIPTELGVCVPFGFIPDDGKTVTEFKQSLRFADTPGVLYTIQTGNVHPRRIKLTPLLAAARASMNPRAPSDEDQTKPVVTQRIGPRLYNIGALTGSQGGVALNVTHSGREKYEMYSVFTGYAGWLGTAVLPYILVDMRTITKAQAAELKKNPPPFKASMDRLELLLKSMRLRPTNPPMPELANQ